MNKTSETSIQHTHNGSPRKETRERKEQSYINILDITMAESFKMCWKSLTQEAQRTDGRVNTMITSRHIMVKLFKATEKRKDLKSRKKKVTTPVEGNLSMISS